MINIDTITKELFYSDPASNIFDKCRFIKKMYPIKVLGIYGQKLDACNIKIRYAARALLFIKQIVKELEHGEFIYFNDDDRLKMYFYAESYLIFIRSTLDLVVSAYFIYRTGKTNLDSFNDFLKKIDKDDSLILPESKEFWSYILEDYKTNENFTWIHTILGREKGLSLRDMIVHKSIVDIDTYIDEKGKGKFYIILSNKDYGHVDPWLEGIFKQCSSIIDAIINDIVTDELKFND